MSIATHLRACNIHMVLIPGTHPAFCAHPLGSSKGCEHPPLPKAHSENTRPVCAKSITRNLPLTLSDSNVSADTMSGPPPKTFPSFLVKKGIAKLRGCSVRGLLKVSPSHIFSEAPLFRNPRMMKEASPPLALKASLGSQPNPQHRARSR